SADRPTCPVALQPLAFVCSGLPRVGRRAGKVVDGRRGRNDGLAIRHVALAGEAGDHLPNNLTGRDCSDHAGCWIATQTAPEPTAIDERAVGAVGILATTSAVAGLIRSTVPFTSTAHTELRPTATSRGYALVSVPGLKSSATGSIDWTIPRPRS